MKQDYELYATKISLLVATITGVMTLNEWDQVLSVVLKLVSILSFMVVFILNVEKLVKKIKDWF